VGRFPPAHIAFQGADAIQGSDGAAYARAIGTVQAPTTEGPTMADKSPRQAMTKKSGKSLKEKRAGKRAKADRASSTVDDVLHIKKH
jgi:hypothetical protein